MPTAYSIAENLWLLLLVVPLIGAFAFIVTSGGIRIPPGFSPEEYFHPLAPPKREVSVQRLHEALNRLSKRKGRPYGLLEADDIADRLCGETGGVSGFAVRSAWLKPWHEGGPG